MKNSKFQYRLLNEILTGMLSEKQKNAITLNILISLEKYYYEGEFFENLLDDLVKREIPEINQKGFKIKTIKFDVGDTLNRHNLYYKYLSEYMLKNNIENPSQVSDAIKNKFIKKSYKNGKKQGNDWFKNNINAINKLIPPNNKISKNFKLNNEITILYGGDNKYPKIEYVSYDHWLNHPRYKKIENELKGLMNNNKFGFYKAINCEAEYFYYRMLKITEIKNKDLFIEKTKEYIFDETIPVIIKNSEQQNIIEIYYGGRDLLTSLYFKGKKAQSDPIIQKYLQGPLKGADQRKFVSIKMVEE